MFNPRLHEYTFFLTTVQMLAVMQSFAISNVSLISKQDKQEETRSQEISTKILSDCAEDRRHFHMKTVYKICGISSAVVQNRQRRIYDKTARNTRRDRHGN